MTIKKLLLKVSILVALAAASGPGSAQQSLLESYPLTVESMQQWRLPNRLNEISGLALSPDGRLFAVDDEVAAIYELDYDEGRIIKVFAFGRPVLRGDFEGIAYLEDKIWLATSSGEIFSGDEGEDGEQMSYQRYESGRGSECEFEGLAADRESHALILACKKLLKGAELEGLAIFSWSADTHRINAGKTVILPERDIRRRLDTDRFDPSGIAIAPSNGNVIILASRQRALVELTPAGELIAARHIPLVSRHRQPEGIEITGDARLLIADEGGSRKARLAVYWKNGEKPDDD